MTRKKSPEEITKANLKKVLDKIKLQVAEREELWVEFFERGLDMVEETSISDDAKIEEGARLADKMLAVYESRWGQAG